jgi:hypothetical protein
MNMIAFVSFDLTSSSSTTTKTNDEEEEEIIKYTIHTIE